MDVHKSVATISTPSVHKGMQIWNTVGQTSLTFTEFIVNIINIYVLN
jgi:hypothetical protein